MNTVILTGGDIQEDFALRILENTFDKVIAVDKGLGFCREHGIVPTNIVGDFDSLDPGILEWYRQNTSIEIREYDPVKDATDTQIAVELAMEAGSSCITILGGTGSRIDHVLGNIQTMYLALEKGADCAMLDPHNRIRLIRGGFTLSREEQYGDYFSLIPFTTDVIGVTLRGVKYPLTGYHFTVQGSAGLGVSNEITGEEARISMENGIMILIESKD